MKNSDKPAASANEWREWTRVSLINDRRRREHAERDRQRPARAGCLAALLVQPFVSAQSADRRRRVDEQEHDRDRDREHRERMPLRVAGPARHGRHEEEQHGYENEPELEQN
jgi:hypothetical protein